MSNDNLTTAVYDASQKTHILDILANEAIRNLPKIKITDADLSADELLQPLRQK